MLLSRCYYKLSKVCYSAVNNNKHLPILNQIIKSIKLQHVLEKPQFKLKLYFFKRLPEPDTSLNFFPSLLEPSGKQIHISFLKLSKKLN